MKGIVILNDGKRELLPVLTSWELIHTDGSNCDSFAVHFLWSEELENILHRAVRFEAWEGTVQRFCGIVDEYQAEWDERGRRGSIYGRGLGGLLMDNKTGEQVYSWVRLGDILRNYVQPYRIPAVTYQENYLLSSYAVDYGTDCWSALSGFCMWAAGIQPRFLADGTLVISKEPGKRRTLDAKRIEGALWRQTRYGVYSRVIAKYAGTYYEEQVEDPAFLALGGSSTGWMTIPRKNQCRAGLCTPEQMLQQKKKNFRVLEITLPELFWAEPGDVVDAELTEMGAKGRFHVVETENRLTETGRSCRLRMQALD